MPDSSVSPTAQAASYTASHAEGKNLLRGETVSVVKNQSEVRTATSPADGSTISTASFCSRGSSYHGVLDLRAPDVFVNTGPWAS
ncbi:hypothetical protein [Amycolatopsis sp. lyj-112]|uniref:hypothetical protein n=1 Tax=Amycolatopsis sp. lyj-112 TaxID=2789288 RepID=UPI00397D75E5